MKLSEVSLLVCLLGMAISGSVRAMEVMQTKAQEFAMRYAALIQKIEPSTKIQHMSAQKSEEFAQRAVKLVQRYLKELPADRRVNEQIGELADRLGIGNANEVDRNGDTPLLVVTKNTDSVSQDPKGLDLKAIILLLAMGADINYKNPKDGLSPLITAISAASPVGISIARMLVRLGADPNSKDKNGVPALLRAAKADKWWKRQDDSLIYDLAAAGADLSERDNQGYGAEDWASTAENKTLIKELDTLVTQMKRLRIQTS